MIEFGDGVALVIGGSGGVGSVICEGLASAGSDVALTYRSNMDAANKTAKKLRETGRIATTHKVELTNEASVASLFSTIIEKHGAIHSIVHAAGSKIDQPYISQLEYEMWRKTMETDVHGAFHVMRAGLEHLRASRGSFVFISSAGLKRYPPGDVLSVAPKGAIEALVRGLAREEGRNGVRANSVALGIIEAGMFRELVKSGELDATYLNASRKNIALRRFGQPEEVANAVVFLASKASSYVTGQTMYLDGGYSI